MAALLGVAPGAGDHRPSAAALGKAMQRTNILRDIDEDLAAGRVYLARETVERFGVAGPRRSARSCCATRSPAPTRSTTRASPGSRCCAAGRGAIRAAAAMYREILRQIEREGYGARAGRAVVPKSRKLIVAARSVRPRSAAAA